MLKTTGIHTSLAIGSVYVTYVHYHVQYFLIYFYPIIILSKYICVRSRINHTKDNPRFTEIHQQELFGLIQNARDKKC